MCASFLRSATYEQSFLKVSPDSLKLAMKDQGHVVFVLLFGVGNGKSDVTGIDATAGHSMHSGPALCGIHDSNVR